MRRLERLGLSALRRIDPETAHRAAIHALRSGLMGGAGPVTRPRLACSLAGMDLANPVGLAAGFDKNAEAAGALSRAGFGFIELGAATPRPQPGNPRPRLFRLPQDGAVINRFGFNNDGAEAIAARLRAAPRGVPRGINLGANKDSADRAADFAQVLTVIGPHVDFATVNVSSPNTEKLRDLQGPEALSALLAGVRAANAALARPVPIFLKIAPDLNAQELDAIAQVALESRIDGIVATNTTLSRDGLLSPARGEAGGLSGKPLFERSTRVLARLSALTEGAIPLIGVGGVSCAQDAYEKIRAGASAVQLYSALAYEGLSLAAGIAEGLDALLERDGHARLADAVGSGRADWLD
ncbi:quinone-dependent dihydroorotate dehydrogenase [Profundibacterium mesophilum]|uniref:Dihydroorotate dehydrogenase (quinone) n=1 Tax=Profundibacterium mesophilum KAUST100406-0324 TaxID=1037889 RepID=A0A921TDN9_9RHOB|nr:quinone-dependent dihydroorotate dehydrogenase [Profundibacterium mesophilum]KAF0674534.1 Dihydroorotate dehydrogenase [Profundibacterium mesophilum KAUST100406-0324]